MGATCPAAAQHDSTFLDRLSIHGYATFAYAISAEHPQFGIPTDGTVDYDRAAILATYALAPRSHLVVQIAHRDLGTQSAISGDAPLLLDWVYFEQRFGTNARLRIGQEPIPLGIYNDVRYVGTLFPFYRVPYSVYGEGSYTQETLEGVTFAYTVGENSAFPLDLNVYAGQYDFNESWANVSSTGQQVVTVAKAVAHKTFGGFAWVRTPIDGLRFGAGGLHYGVQGGVWTPIIGPAAETDIFTSIDADFDRVVLRSEYGYEDRGSNGLLVVPFYVQGGVRVLDGVTINAQLEKMRIHLRPLPVIGPAGTLGYQHDVALGVDVRTPWFSVLKVEGHLAHGYALDDNPAAIGPATRSQYVITSLSFAF